MEILDKLIYVYYSSYQNISKNGSPGGQMVKDPHIILRPGFNLDWEDPRRKAWQSKKSWKKKVKEQLSDFQVFLQ